MSTSVGEIAIRNAVPADEPFLWRMVYYASHSNDEPDVSPADITSNPDLVGYIDGWRAAEHLGVVAESDGVPIGAAWLRLLGPSDVGNPVFIDARTPELAIAVEPGSAGRGVGTSMMAVLIARAAEAYSGLVLSARATSPAVRLYSRFGFVTDREITNRVGTCSVRMVLDL